MSFDESKPVQNGLLISADHRANFLATRQALASINWLQDPLFECWPVNDTTAPATWTLSGAGATIARETAAADVVLGDMAPRVTFGAAIAILSQFILNTGDYDDFFDARTVTAMVMVKQSVASIAELRINDGADFTDSVPDATIGAFVPLFVEHEVNAAADRMELQLRTTGAGNVIWDAAVFLFSDIRPNRFTYPITVPVTIGFARPGIMAVGSLPTVYPMQRAAILRHSQAHLVSAPTGSVAKVDIEQGDGASGWASVFAAGNYDIGIAIENTGSAVDGTYNRRCFREQFGGQVQGGLMRASIDQVGATLPGTDLTIVARGKGWARPSEILLGQ